MLRKKISGLDAVGKHLSPMSQRKRKEDSADHQSHHHYLLKYSSPLIFSPTIHSIMIFYSLVVGVVEFSQFQIKYHICSAD